MAANIQDAIMLFGDSLTEGSWKYFGIAARLSHMYGRTFDVLNRGFSGYNTEWALPVFEQVFAKQHEQHHAPRVRLLLIWFGANDACLPLSRQHVPLARFGENLAAMIRMITSPTSPHYSPETKILLLTPPPVSPVLWGAELATHDPPGEQDRAVESSREYAAEVERVGQREGVPVVDVWNKVWDAAGKDEKGLERFLYDGLHLNDEGYKIVFDELVAAITQHYFELQYEQLQYVFPPWRYFFDHTVEEFKAERWVHREHPVPAADASAAASSSPE
ncbi:SGNH hydrolase [Artomyces pyxidatus]|uniref:SGNH hydrolase n=1 Tax=Artomyces pyxidatus TaxID=48021 RepID=A0ACB8SSJ7_9AGAM|nr:SGNH hydrolase [Artomyces pyxidatus]